MSFSSSEANANVHQPNSLDHKPDLINFSSSHTVQSAAILGIDLGKLETYIAEL